MSRHRNVRRMVDEYFDDYEDYDDYGDYDDCDGPAYITPKKPAAKKKLNLQPTKKILTPKGGKVSGGKKEKTEKESVDQLSKKVSKINIEEELERRFKDEKPVVSVVVIGHVDAGKSTLVAQLSLGVGNLENKEMRKLQKSADELGKSSFGLAFMMDSTEDERERGVTIDVGEAKIIEFPKYRLALLDAPGHKDFVPAMISKGAAAADSAMLIVDSSVGKFESGFSKKGQTREHLIIIRALGCQKIIIAINKMDKSNFSEERFLEIKSEVGKFLSQIGFTKKNVIYVPIAGISGIGVNTPCGSAAPWYKGTQLYETFEGIDIPDRTALRHRPLRASVTEYSQDSNGVIFRIRMECGNLAVGDKIRVCPTMQDAIVKKIIEPPVKVLTVPDIGEIRLAGIELEEVAPANMISSYNLSVPKAVTFTCQVKVLECDIPILPGLPLMFYSRGNSIDSRVDKLVSILDKNGAIIKYRPKILKTGDFGCLDIRVQNGINCEKWEDVKELSRVILRYSGETIGIGKIINYKPE